MPLHCAATRPNFLNVYFFRFKPCGLSWRYSWESNITMFNIFLFSPVSSLALWCQLVERQLPPCLQRVWHDFSSPWFPSLQTPCSPLQHKWSPKTGACLWLFLWTSPTQCFPIQHSLMVRSSSSTLSHTWDVGCTFSANTVTRNKEPLSSQTLSLVCTQVCPSPDHLVCSQ